MRGSGGFTIVEVMVAAVLMIIGVLGTVALVDGANQATDATRLREGGTNLAREVVETARGVSYPQLTDGAIASEIQALNPGLDDTREAAGWTVRRRQHRYTVVATACSVDDPKDGTGDLDPGIACDDVPSGDSGDSDPDDYKRVVVDVSWEDTRRDEQSTNQTTLVNNPGNAAGPAVQELRATNPDLDPSGDGVITMTPSNATGSIEFEASTSSVAETLSWSVDGGARGNATTSNGLTWNFDWNVSDVYDDTYVVSAKGFSPSGAFGTPRSRTVKLNRDDPIAPDSFLAGRNGSAVELEWLPNPEGDIVGYRVYRMLPLGGLGLEICNTDEYDTACRDTAPLAGVLDYAIRAVDLDETGAPNLGGELSYAKVNLSNTPPLPPSDLQAERTDDVVTLTWSAPPPPGDPDPGDEIAYYRIYRDGTGYNDRYDRTGSGDDLEFVDDSTDGESHQYWISAVDTQLGESVLVGPVEL
jgi:hypothetical protein